MSIRAMNWVWEYSRTVGSDLLVLLAIADRANDEGLDAWPSVATLARKTRMHPRTVQRCIRRIEAIGELEVRAGHGRVTNTYVIRMDNLTLQETSRPRRRRREPRHAATPGNLPGGGASAVSEVAPVPPQTPGTGAVSEVAPAPPPPGTGAVSEVALVPPNTSVHPDPSCTRTPAAPAHAPTPPARIPGRTENYHVIARLARELLERAVHQGRPLTSVEALIEELKGACARVQIDYGRTVDPDVCHRAAAAEWFKHEHGLAGPRVEAQA